MSSTDKASTLEVTNRLKGGLYGLLIGDAVGVPYEFHPLSDIPARALIEMEPPARFQRAHATVKPGTWSDDGSLALCLLDSLLECDSLNLPNLASKFLAWGEKGYLAVDGRVFDIGIQTRQALENLKRGVSPDLAGPQGERNNGNGSLMRVLPLALWHRGDDEELVSLAHKQSLVTHGHIHSQVCCALYVLVAKYLLEGHAMTEAWERAEKVLTKLYEGIPLYASALEFVLASMAATPNGSGYVVDSLWSAKKACEEATYENVVKAAIELGNDTDTTACIAGGLAGIHFGFDAIPLRWTDALRGRELVKPLEKALLLRL
jgi:ADP-ribosylglycohydrolase